MPENLYNGRIDINLFMEHTGRLVSGNEVQLFFKSDFDDLSSKLKVVTFIKRKTL